MVQNPDIKLEFMGRLHIALPQIPDSYTAVFNRVWQTDLDEGAPATLNEPQVPKIRSYTWLIKSVATMCC